MNAVRFFLLLLFLYFLIAVQTAVAHHLSTSFLFANLPLLLIISAGLFISPAVGSIFGFIGGLIFDLSAGTIVGLNVVSYTITGFLAGVLEKNIKAEERLTLAIMLGCMTLFNYVIYGAFIGLTGAGVRMLQTAQLGIAPSIINSLIFLTLFKLIRPTMDFFATAK